MKPWSGVFPAITAQMPMDGLLDLHTTACPSAALIASRLTGIVGLGSLAKTQHLTAEEKRLVTREMIAPTLGRVPQPSGVVESAASEGERKAVMKVIHDGIASAPSVIKRK